MVSLPKYIRHHHILDKRDVKSAYYFLNIYHLTKVLKKDMHVSFFRRNLNYMELTEMDYCLQLYGKFNAGWRNCSS